MGLISFFKKKKQAESTPEFVSYIEPMMRADDLVMKVVQKANDLGLEGKKVKVLLRRNSLLPTESLLSSLWFVVEK